MSNIENFDVYTSRMSKSLLDKLFFIGKIYEPIKCIIDFGCADGALIKAAKALFPEYIYIGYDINEKMLLAARENVRGAFLFSNWDVMMDFLKEENIRTSDCLINISSTIHEVYSYGTKSDIQVFWERILTSGFRYISIRDMAPAETAHMEAPINADLLAGLRKRYAKQLEEYESVWGKITTSDSNENWYNLIHFLLKYKYIENWDREMRENYLPVSIERIRGMVEQSRYEILHTEHYILPYVKQQIFDETGISIPYPTHYKMFLKLKN